MTAPQPPWSPQHTSPSDEPVPPRHNTTQSDNPAAGVFSTASQEPDIADWWQRLVARIIDGVGFVVVLWILTELCYAVYWSSWGFTSYDYSYRWSGSWFLPGLLSGVVSGLLYAGYDIYMHTRFGATAGKMLLKLKLARLDRQPPSTAIVLKRALLYPGIFALVGAIPALGIFTYTSLSLLLILVTIVDGIFVLIDQVTRQALHDRFVGTVVLKTPGSPTLG
jgi:uncharacterized RDD family membrane protein YckC